MHWVGNGFPVRSVFDYNGLGRELSPFLLLDYAAPYQFPPGNEKRGVGGHPHKGFETVTVAYQGELEHRDSSGGSGKIGAGDVQWMTAGNGIVHEEFHSADFARHGGTLQMVQLWVNLRAQDKSAEAGYQTLLKVQIPTVELPQDAGAVRVNDLEHPAPFRYLRLREPPYDDAALQELAARVRAVSETTYVYFRHEDAPTAPAYAQRLLELLSGE